MTDEPRLPDVAVNAVAAALLLGLGCTTTVYQVVVPVSLDLTPADTTIVQGGSVPLVASARDTLATLFDEARVRFLDSTVVRRLALGGGPHGVAASPAGVAYVTRLFADSVQRLDLATRAFAAAVAVGAVPTPVTFGADGTTAYVSTQNA